MREKLVKIDNPYISQPVKDETQRIYDLSRFDAEIMIFNKIFQNEEISYPDKIRVQKLVYSEKNQDFVIFFIRFLENFTKKQTSQSFLKESTYCFVRDMIFRIVLKKLTEEKLYQNIFNLIYAFQFLKYETSGSICSAKKDLMGELIFQNDEFWISAFYIIFAIYKNKNNFGNYVVKDLLILNYQSLTEIRKSKSKSVEIMKKIMSLNLGFSAEYIFDESEVKTSGRNDLILYKEGDVEFKRSVRIFDK